MINITTSINGTFNSAPEFMIHKSESDSGILEIREVRKDSVQLTIRESEYAAGVSITVDRVELEAALEKG